MGSESHDREQQMVLERDTTVSDSTDSNTHPEQFHRDARHCRLTLASRSAVYTTDHPGRLQEDQR